MFAQDELDRLIVAMRANGVVALDVTCDDDTLRLHLEEPTFDKASAAPATPLAPKRIPAKSPGIGGFVPRGIDDGLPPLDGESVQVSAGDTLGYIAHGLTRLRIIAPANGLVTGDVPATDRVFGYGDAVFYLETSA